MFGRPSIHRQLFHSTKIRPDTIEWPVTLSTDFETRVFTATKERLALTQGARIQLNNSRLLIEEIHRRGTTISITFRFIGVLPIPGVDMEEAGLFALYDPSTGAASFAEHRESYASDALGLLTTGSFELNFRNLDRLEHPEGPLELYFVHLDLLGIDVRRVDYRVHR